MKLFYSISVPLGAVLLGSPFERFTPARRLLGRVASARRIERPLIGLLYDSVHWSAALRTAAHGNQNDFAYSQVGPSY